MIVERDWLKIATDGGRIGEPAAEDRAVRRRRREEDLAGRGLDYNPLGYLRMYDLRPVGRKRRFPAGSAGTWPRAED